MGWLFRPYLSSPVCPNVIDGVSPYLCIIYIRSGTLEPIFPSHSSMNHSSSGSYNHSPCPSSLGEELASSFFLFLQFCCVSLTSSWPTYGFFSYSMNRSNILIFVTSSDIRYHSSTFKQKSTMPSVVLARSPTISSKETILHSSDMRFLSFSTYYFPTITLNHSTSSPYGCLLCFSTITICREDIHVLPSFLFMVGIKRIFS
jgi:hypothetical protein